jgi:glutamate dehydrogenase
MQAIPSDARTGVIQHLRDYALERMAPEHLQLFLPLVERYYERVAAEDLVARAVPDLFGAALVSCAKEACDKW